MPDAKSSSPTATSCLNPTYPGCSAVIPPRVRRALLARGGSLNPTYPGRSAVIPPRVRRALLARGGVLILLTLDAAL